MFIILRAVYYVSEPSVLGMHLLIMTCELYCVDYGPPVFVPWSLDNA